VSDVHADKIPGWVSNIFGWYVQGNLSEDELIRALQFLVDTGVINLVAPGSNIVVEPILDELTKPELLFYTDEMLTAENADLWISEHTSYMTTANPEELMNKLKSPDGVYHLVVLPENYGQEYAIIDTSGNEITFDDALVIPMTCDDHIYAIQGIGIGEMYFMYNDVRFDSGVKLMQGFCRN